MRSFSIKRRLLWSLLILPTCSSLMSIFGLNTKVVVKPEAVKTFLQALKRNARQTLAEPGCLQFVIGRQVDPPADNIFCIHDQFKDKAAYEKHETMPDFQDFLKEVGPLLESPPTQKTFLCTHEPLERKPCSAFVLDVESIVKSELENEYDELIKSHSANSRLEPACLQFDWGKSVVDDEGQTTYYFHEEYTDRAGFDAHTQTAHFERFVNFNNSKEPYVTPQTIWFYETIDYYADEGSE
mmetsp:Transcript_15079/g.28584  ORF Transcript_15079/g.28584 Transcript_15079/m.28584 type:complete len:240 (-) Transcript_15079:68-787(-)